MYVRVFVCVRERERKRKRERERERERGIEKGGSVCKIVDKGEKSSQKTKNRLKSIAELDA